MKNKESQSIISIWEAKEEIYNETKNLKGREIFDYIRKKTEDFYKKIDKKYIIKL